MWSNETKGAFLCSGDYVRLTLPTFQPNQLKLPSCKILGVVHFKRNLVQRIQGGTQKWAPLRHAQAHFLRSEWTTHTSTPDPQERCYCGLSWSSYPRVSSCLLLPIWFGNLPLTQITKLLSHPILDKQPKYILWYLTPDLMNFNVRTVPVSE